MDDKTSYQAQILVNRILKQYRLHKKWARKNRISCYRLYDRDIPEIPLAIDLYTFLPEDITDKIEAIRFLQEQQAVISENSPLAQRVMQEELARTYLHVYLYERPYEKDAAEEAAWLRRMEAALADALRLPEGHVIHKTRKKQSGTENGRTEQYEKQDTDVHISGIVEEQGQLFKVNLSDYIDTGLFLDHRPLRSMIRQSCKGKSVLNLFCYTGTFSVYAAEGGAKSIESVDLSKTYIEWAKENCALNGFSAGDGEKCRFMRQDVTTFLQQTERQFDIIILDPPTFSNSKRMNSVLNLNHDWSALIRRCLFLLTDTGTLYFSTNSRRLKFDAAALPQDMPCTVQDISAETIPVDFRNGKIHRAWNIKKAL